MRNITVICLGISVFMLGRESHSLSTKESKKGLFADISIVVDGVTVRRVRDGEAGTLCYVASTPGTVQSGTHPAISCVGWEP